MPHLVIASTNAGKIREIKALLEGSGWDALSPAEAEMQSASVVESGRTYLENALMKASMYARVSGMPALADDSGLEVDALGGRPGVLSARYGGPAVRDDRARTQRLLEELAETPARLRTARFRCIVALALPDGMWHVREGLVEGRIATSPRGQSGFGYDPVFELPDGRTLAEIGEEKQRISHRAVAIRAMIDVLKDLYDDYAQLFGDDAGRSRASHAR